MDVRNQIVTVVGLGESGLKAALLLERNGAIVRVTDSGETEDIRKNSGLLEQKFIDFELGGHSEPFLEDTELFVVSPGVPDSALPVRYAVENRIPVISELELGFLFCPAPVMAITGTNGKSTVTKLAGKILEDAGKKAVVCGNIGNSFCGEIDNITAGSVVVLEVSSFQLEHCSEFRPKVSVILNVTEDHLDRYAGFEEYLAAKKRVFSRQQKDDFCVLNFDDERLKDIKGNGQSKRLYFSREHKVEGVYLRSGDVICSIGDREKTLFSVTGMKLKGQHNEQNILASTLIALLNGVDAKVIEGSIAGFEGLEHRYQAVAVVEGVEFIDDSKATNIDAARYAIRSAAGPVILIAGGRDKMGDYGVVKDEIREKVKKMILIGEAAERIEKAFGDIVGTERCATLEEAVKKAFQSAEKGDMVLLSPMCSSYDMFRDYKHRGDVFRESVKKLQAEAQ